MSQVFVFSIGLNVGATEPTTQLGATLRACEALFGPPLSLAMGGSEWDGVPERFVQIAVLTTAETITRDAPKLAAALHQTAVAETNGRRGWMLHFADGKTMAGGPMATFPIIVAVPSEE